MNDKYQNKDIEYLPPERPLGKDPLRMPDPNGDMTFIDRVLSDWRQKKAQESWKAHAAALEAMRQAFISKTDDD